MDPNTRALIMGAAGAGGAEKVYVEDVFSTWLYTSTNSTLSVVNDIDLSTKGGLVWIKSRSSANNHCLTDTARGVGVQLNSNSTGANNTAPSGFGLTSFNTTGFTLGQDYDGTNPVTTTAQASWTFRKQAKFFDVVTYTGDGTNNRQISHSLGSSPGVVIVKRTIGGTGDWFVWHRSLAGTNYNLYLNTTNASAAFGDFSSNGSGSMSASSFCVNGASTNISGDTFVAYLFAHNAGGFGASGNDSVVSCGSFTTDGSGNATVNLGWEPQWVLVKNTQSAEGWYMFDAMRGWTLTSNILLQANLANAEGATGAVTYPTSTGFYSSTVHAPNETVAYIAIRRGPMKTPTDATKVFQPKVYTGTNVDNRLVTTDIVTDMAWVRQRNDTTVGGMVVGDRMRGQPYLRTGAFAAEVNDANSFDRQLVSAVEYGTAWSSMTGFWVGNDATSKLNANTTSNNHVVEAFRRAPGFFDVVAYTGTGANRTVSHNLAVAPELIVAKARPTSSDTFVCVPAIGMNNILLLNTTGAVDTGWGDPFNSTSPTASVFSLSSGTVLNAGSELYIAYLFASCSGVSKVGSYTGTGTTLQVNCGFTAGARFVLIKRTDSTGGWHVWDTARGIASGNDPYLLLNSTGAEVTNTDYIDPLNSGFEISSTAPAAINANGGTFIYLAIA